MNDRTNLYADLGLTDEMGRVATPDELRAAYRARAKLVHPDTPGGSAEAFLRAKAAFDVLSDPERRKHYDATGEWRHTAPENLLFDAMAEIEGVLDGLVATDPPDGVAIETHNVPKLLVAMLDHIRKIAGANALLAQAKVTRTVAIATRFRQKDAEVPLAAIVAKRHLAVLNSELSRVRHRIRALDKAIEILNSTEFEAVLRERIATYVDYSGAGSFGGLGYGLFGGGLG